MKRWLIGGAAVCVALASWQGARACMHLPADYEGSIEQLAQGGIVVFKDGRQDLILKHDFLVDGMATPENLAWIVPVPNAPIEYGVLEGDDPFESIYERWKADDGVWRDRTGGVAWQAPPSRSADLGFTPRGVMVLDTRSVGPYAIQVVQATSADALNAWLRDNGFGEVPPQNMAYYVKKTWTWVCVKTAPEGVDGTLKPLRIAFKSESMVYPLKFSSHQGTFNLNVWVISEEPSPDLEGVKGKGPKAELAEQLPRIGATARFDTYAKRRFDLEGRWLPLTGSAGKLVESLGLENTPGAKVPFVTKISVERFEASEVAKWRSDLELTAPKPQERNQAPSAAAEPPGVDSPGGLIDPLQQTARD